jgi:hypothetical protein
LIKNSGFPLSAPFPGFGVFLSFMRLTPAAGKRGLNSSFFWDVSKSTVCESVQWVEDTLIKDGTFRLPVEKVLRKSDDTIQYAIADVTESPIERPKKNKQPRNKLLGKVTLPMFRINQAELPYFFLHRCACR